MARDIESILSHGASLVPAAIRDEEAGRILGEIDQERWSSEIGRRVQHYGFRYRYTGENSRPEPAPAFPPWAEGLADIVGQWMGTRATQCIVNEYRPGQGIGMHADARTFGPCVVSVSLGAAWEMRFRQRSAHPYERNGLEDDERLRLPVGSALVLAGNARWSWMHGICRRQSAQETARRVSVTFRTLA